MNENSAEQSNKLDYDKRKYWLFSPGRQASYWDEFLDEGIMAIGWDSLGDLSKYQSREAIVERLQENSGEDESFTHDSLATWDFVNTIQPGDVIYAKRGMTKIIGRGVVKSDFKYDDYRPKYKNIRKVNWTNQEECDYPAKLVPGH